MCKPNALRSPNSQVLTEKTRAVKDENKYDAHDTKPIEVKISFHNFNNL